MLNLKSKRYIEEWILEDLSKPDPRFNMLPRCPYAKKALIDKKILFVEVQKNFYSTIKELIKNWDDTYDVAVVHMDWSLTCSAVEQIRIMCNDMYNDNNFIFIEDFINKHNINVMLMQRMTGLEKARQQLKETGYYSGDPQ